MSTDRGPLSDVRVLDASRVLAGPFCGQVLADLGAEVLKVERPGTGDETRAWGPPFVPYGDGQISAYFLSCNRGKRSVTLDLGQPQGLEIFDRLLARSDVLLENFRSASADRLGLGPERLLQVNPRLVICSISGFGRTGPLRDVPGYDFAIQALSGLMSITGPVDGPPAKTGVAVTDVLTGLYAAVAVLACLHARRHSGHGYAIDLALLDCAIASQVNVAQAFLSSGQVPARQGNAHLQIVPYQLFATADDYLVLAVGNDGQWNQFCQAAGKVDWREDFRYATNAARVQHRDVLVPLVESLMRTRTSADWQERLGLAGVPCAPVWNYGDLFSHPQAAARSFKIEVRDPQGRPIDLIGPPFHLTGTPLPTPLAPPQTGQHTDEVLRQVLGLDAAQIQALRQGGVI